VRTAQGEQVVVIRARRSDAPARAVARDRLTPAAEIALLCAREQIDVDPDGSLVPGRVERLRDRCGEVDDWEALGRTVGRLGILPLVHQHLRRAAADVVPEVALEQLAAAARSAAVRNLQAADLHLQLHRDILTPMGVPHVFLKGTTLAHRFYAQPNLRVALDVDVLVPEGELERIAHALRDLGFRPKTPAMGTDDGIRYASRVLVGGCDWVSPAGVLVEVHGRLQFQAGRLAPERLLVDNDHVLVAGVPLPTLTLSDTVSHLCLHHTRSSWTRLSWVADLDAMLRSTGADPAALIVEARARRFGRVVAASLGLHRALARPEPAAPFDAMPADPAATDENEAVGEPLAAELHDVCIESLASAGATGGVRPSRSIRRRSSRVAYVDLAPAHRLRVRVRSLIRQFRPQGVEFLRLPLPAHLQWTYFLLRPILRLVHGPYRPPEAGR
jgi:hypothetical protein